MVRASSHVGVISLPYPPVWIEPSWRRGARWGRYAAACLTLLWSGGEDGRPARASARCAALAYGCPHYGWLQTYVPPRHCAGIVTIGPLPCRWSRREREDEHQEREQALGGTSWSSRSPRCFVARSGDQPQSTLIMFILWCSVLACMATAGALRPPRLPRWRGHVPFRACRWTDAFTLCLLPFSVDEIQVRTDVQEIDHDRDRVPGNHRPRQNQQPVGDPDHLKDAHDARHPRIDPRTGPPLEHGDQVWHGGKGRAKPRHKAKDL